MTAPPPRRFRVGRTTAGLGLFALVPFPKGARVIEYTGERITAAEADRRRGRYLFEIDATWTIDGKDRDNLARYINHACRPNCEPRVIGRRVVIYARRAIRPGEELTYNYGRVYFAAMIAPAGCRCATCLRRQAA
jgi:SET domain-containing protein